MKIVGTSAQEFLLAPRNMQGRNAFGLQRIAWCLVPTAMALLWLVGQAAVYGPARRATTVPPAMATRSV
ncbi:MAG: hypothetical protein GTN98_11380 [Woeseiaceae bacterium]|nr:hypothetical protein [Woeseiaceae bacterium]